jgi:hypothetical protein
MDEAELKAWVRRVAVPHESPDQPDNEKLFWRYYALAGHIIVRTLGAEWFEQHIAPADRPTDHFRGSATEDVPHNRFFSRVVELGELIYNLHTVENFADRLERIRQPDGRGVESGIAELAAGKFFRAHAVMFRFMEESQERDRVKGQEYDIEYATTDGRLGRCEVKCKLQAGDLTANGIKNTLKDAKDQLPKGVGTGIVMVRIPEEWHEDGDAALDELSGFVDGFFESEKTKRISSVVLIQYRTVRLPDQLMAQTMQYADRVNLRCPIRSGLPPIMTPGVHAMRNWKSLTPLVS